MNYKAGTFEEYMAQIPEERQAPFEKLYKTIKKNLPKGFRETVQYSMPGFVVPLDYYPPGYHCAPETPLPFINIASQKNFIAFYHMGIYASPELYKWFVTEYPKHCKTKLDMGKSCVRFKKMDDIPFDLIAETVRKIDVDAWIALYEKNYVKKK